MLRSIFTQIAPILRWRNGLLNPQALPFIKSQHFESTYMNESVEQWIKTLPEDMQKRVRLIQNELALKLTEMKKVPKLDRVTIADYNELLEMSVSRRQKYYYYLFTNSNSDTMEEIKKQVREQVKQEKAAMGTLGIPKTNHIEYGLGKNTLLMKITGKTINKWKNMKCHRAIMLNEPPLVFDCGFNDAMSRYEINDTAKQLKYAFSANRSDKRPFILHWCNMNKDSLLWRRITNVMPNIEKLPIKIHSEDITEVFPPEKIVFLTPDAEDVIQEFNRNDTYVIGSLVDKAQRMPITLAKAKRLNIRTMRLPLDQYIKFHSHKTLTLDQMTQIMLELKRSQDWTKALRRIPTRKIFG